MARWSGWTQAPGWRLVDMGATVDARYGDSIAVVEFNNPPANALSRLVIDELEQVVSELEGREDIRAVVFTAAGAVSFLSGADLTEMPALLADAELLAARMAEVGQLYSRIEELPQVTVAAAGASAMGGGLEFLLVCDLVVASERAKFGLPEVRIGLIPGAGGTQRLFRRVPAHRAREMLILGSAIAADDALAIGLVNRVCSPDNVLAGAMELATEVAGLPGVAVRSIKRAIAAGIGSPLGEGLERERTEFWNVAKTADAKEGPAAFLERRRPLFAHR
jgi:enoyl-CoA hydratase/carnithine racemase